MKNEIPYNIVQNLLSDTFKAEKLYYESAEDIQVVALARYLYHQSSIRSKFAQKIIEGLIEEEIEPKMLFIPKGKLNRSGLEELRALEDHNYIRLIENCFEADELLLNLCEEVLEHPELPITILEAVTSQMTELLFESIEGAELLQEVRQRELQQQSVDKVVQLPRSVRRSR